MTFGLIAVDRKDADTPPEGKLILLRSLESVDKTGKETKHEY